MKIVTLAPQVIIDQFHCYLYLIKYWKKTIYLRLKQFLDKHNILYKYQFGFRENHSTSHASIDLADSYIKNHHQMKTNLYLGFTLI